MQLDAPFKWWLQLSALLCIDLECLALHHVGYFPESVENTQCQNTLKSENNGAKGVVFFQVGQHVLTGCFFHLGGSAEIIP